MDSTRKYSYRRASKKPDPKVVENLNVLAETTTYQKPPKLVSKEQSTYEAAVREKEDLELKLQVIEELATKKGNIVKRIKELSRFIERMDQLDSTEEFVVQELIAQSKEVLNPKPISTEYNTISELTEDTPLDRLSDFKK